MTPEQVIQTAIDKGMSVDTRDQVQALLDTYELPGTTDKVETTWYHYFNRYALAASPLRYLFISIPLSPATKGLLGESEVFACEEWNELIWLQFYFGPWQNKSNFVDANI